MQQTAAELITNEHPLDQQQLAKMHAYWRACNYLAAGMIYLQDNPLLQEPLRAGTHQEAGSGTLGRESRAFLHVPAPESLIKQHDLNAIFPGRTRPRCARRAGTGLPGRHLFRDLPDTSVKTCEGMKDFFKQFSFPGGIGSHCTPETPGSIHEGGELGYSISHAFGAAFDNPDLLVTVAVGDGEAETGPLATSWHSSKFLNPIRDGAVLPILHLNGYKINNPTILSRIPTRNWKTCSAVMAGHPISSKGDDPQQMHQTMAATMDRCLEEIHAIQQQAREKGRRRVPAGQ